MEEVEQQVGSQPWRSELTLLWVDEGRAVDVVYFDFSKAFDTVSHNTLVGKLRKCGIDELDCEVG